MPRRVFASAVMTLLYGFGRAGPEAPRPVVSWPLPAPRERSADGYC